MIIKYFRVSLLTVDYCSGMADGSICLGNFSSREKAEKCAKEWELTHQGWTKWGMGYDCKYNLAKELRPELKTSEEIEKYVKNKILKEYGTNPWAIIHTKKALTEAFKNKDTAKIMFETINLAHYIADSCVVFHCTANSGRCQILRSWSWSCAAAMRAAELGAGRHFCRKNR